MRAARLPDLPVQALGKVIESEQLRERGYFVELPGVEPAVRVPGAPYRLSRTPWRPPGPAPRLDAAPAAGWEPQPAAPREDELHEGDQQPPSVARIRSP